MSTEPEEALSSDLIICGLPVSVRRTLAARAAARRMSLNDHLVELLTRFAETSTN